MARMGTVETSGQLPQTGLRRIEVGDEVAVQREADRIKKRIAGEVRAYMARARVTEAELGEVLCRNQQWVHRRTSGAVAFSGAELKLVADYLSVNVSTFFDWPPDDFYDGRPGRTATASDFATGEGDVTVSYPQLAEVVPLRPALAQAS